MKLNEKRVNECLATLLKKKGVVNEKGLEYVYKGEDKYLDEYIKVDGKEIPLLYWRGDPTVRKVCSYNGRVGDVISCKIQAYHPRNVKLTQLMFQEYDISEYYLEGEIKHVMGFINGDTANILARMNNERLSTLELSTTMPEEATPQGKQTLYGREGFASDMVVTNHIKPEAIYVYTDSKTPETYTDVVMDLYGYSEQEIIRAGLMYQIIIGQVDVSGWQERYDRLKRVVEDTYLSSEKKERIYTEK